jgi:large subunit ribosomal protein L5
MVTLRGNRMYEFLDRLLNIAIPRIRDFRGLSEKSFDGKGNYTIGVKEQVIFPEVDYESIVSIKGMNITITSSADNNDEAIALFKKFGFPFRK